MKRSAAVTAASTHLEIWDKLARPDPKALKQFQRAGGFKGTAINPMHTLHSVTEVFGPCGTGWGMTQPDFQVVGSNVYCTVGVWYGQSDKAEYQRPMVWGVGGEALTGRGDDEAFKKAYTDALGNALKHLGANADIYFGAWDGNKYVDEKPAKEPAKVTPYNDEERPSEMPSVNGTEGASKAAFREPFDAITKAIRNAPNKRELKAIWTANAADIDEWPPDFVDLIKLEYLDRKKELEKVLA
jgi:hypothetical protein